MPILEETLDQKHIHNRSRHDTEQCISFPEMQSYHNRPGDQFRNPMRRRSDTYVFQAVYDQHSHNGIGQNGRNVRDIVRCFFIFPENHKGKKTQKHRNRRNNCDQHH